MGRKAEVSLYRQFHVEGTDRYVLLVKSGRGWAPKTKAVGEPTEVVVLDLIPQRNPHPDSQLLSHGRFTTSPMPTSAGERRTT